ncbi:MAG: ribosome maturation factor RimP [Bryobacteraceae bacterium]
MNREQVIARVREAAERVAASEGVEVVDVELRGSGPRRLLRIYIDKPEGVSHRDCELVSEQLSVILDVEDLVPGGSYTLEVSSPGVERKLVTPRDYERFVGRKIKVVLREPVQEQRHWEGVLAGFAEGVVTLEPSPGRRLQLPLAQIQRANLKFEW